MQQSNHNTNKIKEVMWQLNRLPSRTEELRAEHLHSGSSGDQKADPLLKMDFPTWYHREEKAYCQEEKQTEAERITSRKNRGSKNRRLETWLHASARGAGRRDRRKILQTSTAKSTQQQKTVAWAMLENMAGAEPKESVLTENKTEEPKNPPEKSRAGKIVRKHAYRRPLAEELITREQDLSRPEWWIEKETLHSRETSRSGDKINFWLGGLLTGTKQKRKTETRLKTNYFMDAQNESPSPKQSPQIY
jgi:hypothetical protein